MMTKQVDRTHYDFTKYVDKARWCSIWHQIDEVQRLKPDRVLEIGPGPGIFKAIGTHVGINIETLDIDPDLQPDHVASALELPFEDASFDVVCAFQMLEHLPYQQALQVLREMKRVSRGHVVISLPETRSPWLYRLHIPSRGQRDFLVRLPRRLVHHKFDGEHYWELNTSQVPHRRFSRDLCSIGTLIRSFSVHENTYHRFFVIR